MKTRIISLSITCLFLSVISFGQKAKNDTIKVWGNCGMCQKTIEKAAKDAGATYASWSDETQLLVVKYNSGSTNSKKIQEKIAAKGYDTQDLTASKAAYDKLHGCCKYERKAAATCCKDEAACTKDGCCNNDLSCCKGDNAKMECCKDGKTCCKKD